MDDARFAYYFTWIGESRFENGDDSDMFELGAHWELNYWNTDLGSFDLDSDIEFLFLLDSAGLDLPDQLSEMVVNLAWNKVMGNGYTLTGTLHPGFYSDFKEFSDGLFLPVSLSLSYAFAPDWSGQLGIEYRADWEREVRPIVGVGWQAGRDVRLKLALPSSILEINAGPEWFFQIGYDWNNTDYALDSSREQITMEEYRLYVRINHVLSGRTHVFGEIGELSNRSIEFKNSGGNEIDIDDEMFIRLGLGGPF
jgi:hypothetical protein